MAHSIYIRKEVLTCGRNPNSLFSQEILLPLDWNLLSNLLDGVSISLLNVVFDHVHAFAVNNNMRLNPRKWKTMTVDFLHYNGCVLRPIAVGGSDIEQGRVVRRPIST